MPQKSNFLTVGLRLAGYNVYLRTADTQVGVAGPSGSLVGFENNKILNEIEEGKLDMNDHYPAQ